MDRHDVKQYRELYGTPEAVKAVREGKPVPSGSVALRHPADLRNGEWEYARFTPDGKLNTGANDKACFPVSQAAREAGLREDGRQ